MAITFPTNPAHGDKYSGYIYNSTDNAWSKVTAGDVSSTVNYGTVNDLPLTGNNPGDQVYVTGNNRLYIWNGDGWYNIALINTAPQITQGGAGAYVLANDGTPTVITLIATDPEELPITWSYSVTSGSLGNTATVSQADNVFTITPSTNSADEGTFSITFTASDGVNLSTDVNSFELVFLVEDSNYTSALITSVGSNGSTNSTVTDGSTNNHTVTVNGNASSQTFSPYRSGGYSYYFDGDGTDYFEITSPTAALDFGTGDFTVELWIWQESYGTLLVDNRPTSVNGDQYWGVFSIETNGNIKLNTNNITRVITTSTPVIEGSWNHIALQRNSGTLEIYVNGTREATATYTGTFESSHWRLFKNAFSAGGIADGSGGYIRDFRVVKGTAVYSGTTYDVPTETLTNISGTSLLLFTTNNPQYEVVGNETISWVGGFSKPFGPYDYKEYDAATYGGSLYFDGSTGYATVPADTTNLTLDGDFTIDFWVYPTSAFSNEYVYGKWNNNPDGWTIFLTTDWSSGNMGSLTLYYGTYGLNEAATSIRTEKIKQNQWNHCRITRQSNVIYMAINGVVGARSNYGANGLSWDDTRSFNADATLGIGGHTNYKYGPGYIADLRVIKGTALTTTNFTPPTEPVTAITNTSLLISGTDAAIIDKAQSTQLTLDGNTQSSTTITKYGSSSMAFDGSGDYISIPDGDWKTFGTNDFTIEMWFNSTSTTKRQYLFSDIASSGQNDTSSVLLYLDAGALKVYIQDTTYHLIQGSTSYSANTWHHVAVVRNGSTVTLYLDGQSEGTYSIGTASVNDSSNGAKIGRADFSTSYDFTGYLEDVRITKGLARYTANFTPPSASLKG